MWEWCHDVYDREPHYSTFAMLGVDPEDILTVDPYGPEEGDTRVLKGAGWDSMARLTSPGERLELAPYDHLRTAGFRLARTMY